MSTYVFLTIYTYDQENQSTLLCFAMISLFSTNTSIYFILFHLFLNKIDKKNVALNFESET